MEGAAGLALHFGLRYTPVTAPSEVNGLSPVDFDCDCRTFGPQFGLAWHTPGAGVIRAAYGLHFGEIYPQTLQQVRWDPPNFLKVEVQAPASILDPLAGMDLGPGARHMQFDVPRDLKSPYSHQYTLLWEPVRGRRWSLQLGYIGSRTNRLFMMWFVNRAVPVPGVPLTTATIAQRRPDPRYFELREARNASKAYFDAARVTFRAPSWHGLMHRDIVLAEQGDRHGERIHEHGGWGRGAAGICAIGIPGGRGFERAERVRPVARGDGAVRVDSAEDEAWARSAERAGGSRGHSWRRRDCRSR